MEKWRRLLAEFAADLNRLQWKLPDINSFERHIAHACAEELGLSHASRGEGRARRLWISKPEPQEDAEVDWEDCSDGSEEMAELSTAGGGYSDAATLRAMRDRTGTDGEEWLFAMRKYVRTDNVEALLGLLAQEEISLSHRPAFSEYYNNDPADLSLELHDGFADAISVRDFIRSMDAPRCQAAVADLQDAHFGDEFCNG